MRTTWGGIYRRGRAYYVRYQLRGRDVRHVLRDESGRAIREKEKARAAAEALLMPIRLRADAERLRGVVHQLQSIEQRIADYEAARRGKVPAGELWERFALAKWGNADRPGGGRALLYWYFIHDFAQWLKTYGAAALADITPGVAEKYAIRLRKYPPASCNDRVKSLRHVFAVLAKAGAFSGTNPFAGVELQPEEKHRKQALEREQIRRLIDIAGERGPEWRALFALGYYCGLRRGDAASMLKTEVDYKAQTLTRLPNKTKSRAKDLEKATIVLPIGPQLLAILRALPPSKGPFLLPGIADEYQSRPRELTKQIGEIFAAAGLENTRKRAGGGTKISDYGFHSLRHSFISHAVAAGIPLPIVQAGAGHTTERMTAHYVHADAAARAAFVDALNLTPKKGKRGKGAGKG